MSSERDGVALGQGLKLYRELAEWYPLLTPVADYAEEAAFYRGLFEEHRSYSDTGHEVFLGLRPTGVAVR